MSKHGHARQRAQRYLDELARRRPPAKLLPGQMLGRDRQGTLHVLTRGDDGSYGGTLACVDEAGCVVRMPFTVPELTARQWAKRHEQHEAAIGARKRGTP